MQQAEESVFKPDKIDIDRFDVARSNRNRMKIPDRQVGEDVAFDLKLKPQILLGRLTQRDAIAEPKQERPMKNENETAKNREHDQCAPSPVSNSKTLMS
jgi:hypothetical protein